MSITEVIVQGFDPSCEVFLATDGTHVAKGKGRLQVRYVQFAEVRVFAGGPGVDEQHKDSYHREEALEPHLEGVVVERGLKWTCRFIETLCRCGCANGTNDDNRGSA